ncbi:MAG: hypothetical protein FWF59_03980 [Turicibacter sp.]|nr:hypothetical protein [Turicibacter sp.]
MKPIIFEAKSMEGIIGLAIDYFQCEPEELDIEIIHVKKGVFGIGAQLTCEVATRPDPFQSGLDYLNQILVDLELPGTVDGFEVDGVITYVMDCSNNAFLIGKNAKALQSLQTLVQQVVFVNGGVKQKVIVDVDGYRQKQIDRLESLATNIAKEVIHSKIDVTLDPMNAFERRIIHRALSGWAQIKTDSIGEEPNRRIIIRHK